MELSEYLSKTCETITAFCKRANICRATYYDVIGDSLLYLVTINKIKKATEGEVDLLHRQGKKNNNNRANN
jgi:hypothetical protein